MDEFAILVNWSSIKLFSAAKKNLSPNTGERTYFRRLDETPTVLSAADCARELPVCKLCRPVCNLGEDAISAWRDDVAVAPIEAPCERYDCKIDALREEIGADASVCAAAALLMAVAAYA